ncbi:hypothetical protein LZ554_009244 [Drepanopeziza brunnea f. sp. 'monogermtubi']|nr:hypothetical protein LZ554_009244 [Drepanopeziza brunnea f. sp. 'monogermtubi']
MIDMSATMRTEDDSEILEVWDFGPQKRKAQVYKPSLYEDAEEQMAKKNWADVYRPRRPRSEITKLRPVPSFQSEFLLGDLEMFYTNCDPRPLNTESLRRPPAT